MESVAVDPALGTTMPDVSESTPVEPVKVDDVVPVPPPEAAPTRDDSRTEEFLILVDNQEDQERQQVYQTSSSEDDQAWKEILPPPESDDKVEEEKEGEEKQVGDEEGVNESPDSPVEEKEPDFSKYKTHVAERLHKAQLAADKAGLKSSPELVPLTNEFQKQRKKMASLIRAANEYRDAMRVMTAKKSKFLEQFAVMTEGTPISDHVGKPLTPEQLTDIQLVGDEITPESIEIQSQSIMKVAEELGPGSVLALSQLAAEQEKLNVMDYKTNILDYLDEWDDVVTSLLDDEVKKLRQLSKKKEHYVYKVDRLRNQVNRIEKRGEKEASRGLVEKLERNEEKLEISDNAYEEFANDVAVNLNEAIRRGWVDLYPLLENTMQFEVNRLSRANATFGRLPDTLTAVKDDYKEAVKGTADEV